MSGPHPKPRLARAHSKLVADEYTRLGWRLRRCFHEKGYEAPVEYLFAWDRDGEPAGIDWADFSRRVLT